MRDGDYWGVDVHYAARVASAACGGQVLVSGVTAVQAGDVAELSSLGHHRLKDFPEPLELFALGRGPHPAPRSLDPLRSNLPSAASELIGRDTEAEEIAALLAGATRLVTISGAGGIGKTRLALAVADRLVDRLADGAFLVELAEVTSHEAVASAIARVFGGPEEGLKWLLGGREALVVLDNFEHVLAAAPLVGELIASAPRLRILVTSQAPLRVGGEYVYGLAPLEVPREDTLQALSASPAVSLLIARAQLIARGFAVDQSNAAAVAALCRELDGLPLAIELAAARLSLLDPAGLVKRLRAAPDALGRGPRDLPGRQRGLRAAMSWSFGLLDEEGARLFRRLGHFAGEATLERIEQVCGDGGEDILDSIANLVDFSLVRRTRGGRFELPSALRAFARELLERSGERDELRWRHSQALESELLQVAVEQPMLARPVLRRAVATERADVNALLDWGASAELERFARLLACTYAPFNSDLLLHRWSEAIERAIANATQSGRIRTLLRLAALLLSGRDFIIVAICRGSRGRELNLGV